jgi:hypothetical protein
MAGNDCAEIASREIPVFQRSFTRSFCTPSPAAHSKRFSSSRNAFFDNENPVDSSRQDYLLCIFRFSVPCGRLF